MPSPRIIFINRFYWPDTPATAQLLTDLTEVLATKAANVVVLTSGTSTTSIREERNGVDIVRVSARKTETRGLVGRAVDFCRFLQGSKRWLSENLEREDVVVCLTDPPLLGAAMDRLIRKKGARSIHWVQDIFPEVATAVLANPLLKLFRGRRDRAWQHATTCVVPGVEMGKFVISRKVDPSRIVVIPNWAPAGLVSKSADQWRARHHLTEKFVVMYAGNLGRVHDFSSVVPLATRLKEEPEVVFVFIGQGARRAKLRAEVAAARLTNVRFLDAVPRNELSDALSAGDLHLVTLREGCENLVFPSKLYGIAAVGRPAMVIGPRDCEPARLVRTHGWGAGFTPSEIEDSAAYLRSMKSDSELRTQAQTAALRFAARNGVEAAAAAWEKILNPAFSSLSGLVRISSSTAVP